MVLDLFGYLAILIYKGNFFKQIIWYLKINLYYLIKN
jgi:hypothetical protein